MDFIVTGNRERAADAKTDFPNVQIVASTNQLESHFSELDLLVLAGPPHTHLEQGLAALDAGLAVVVDKPFAPSESDGLQLIEKAEQMGRPLIVFQNRRWDGDFLTVHKVISGGELGDVYQFESSFEHWAPNVVGRWQDTMPSSQGGGVTFDLGSHLIDQALVLFGPVADVHADLRTVREGGGNDDVSSIELIHESGVHSRLWMSRLGAIPGPRFRVLGTRGAYVSYGLDGQESALTAGMKPTDSGYGLEPEETWGTLGAAAPRVQPPVIVPTERGNYPAFYQGVAEAVRGTGPAPVDPRDALEVVKVLERIQSAALFR
ncbi:Gfo/Idh/MocA family oxidoreductase [Arthrobacter tecti]